MMRLLHVSDWHVGLTTGPHARRPDHQRVFGEIVAAVRDLKPDLVLHTGDVFHANYPGVEDMRFGLEALRELAALAPVVVVRGNHDSDRLFRVFALLLGPQSPLRFIDLPPPLSGDPILRVPTASGETIALAALPFVHANRFFPAYTDAPTQTVTFADKLGDYERALGAKLLATLDPAREIAIFAAHQYVAGALKSGSERRLHVGDEYLTRTVDIPAVTYAAFGHIHRPQVIPGPSSARYAGSPIQIDFGEENESKSIVFVEAKPNQTPKITPISLSGGRPLLTAKIELAALPTLAERCAGALCRITVRTPTPTAHLAARVAEALPGADIVDVVEDCAATRVTVIERDGAEVEPSLTELFAEFLATTPVRDAEATRVQAAFATVLAATEAREVASFDELAAGDRA
jgi:exonuclease SbcD